MYMQLGNIEKISPPWLSDWPILLLDWISVDVDSLLKAANDDNYVLYWDWSLPEWWFRADNWPLIEITWWKGQIFNFRWVDYDLVVDERELPLQMQNHWWMSFNPETQQITYSNNIPTKFLRYACINEVLCPEVVSIIEWEWGDWSFKINTDVCLNALISELSYIPKGMYIEYLQWRLWFFSWIRDFYLSSCNNLDKSSKTYGYNISYAEEVWKCCTYLASLLEKQSKG